MRFTPEDLKELDPYIQIVVDKSTYQLRKQVEILQSDIQALRSLAHISDEK